VHARGFCYTPLVNGVFKTDEFKLIASAALFIALPSVVLSVVSLVVLARESRLAEARFREAYEGAMSRSVERTVGRLREGERRAREAVRRIGKEGLSREEAGALVRSLCGERRPFCAVYLLGPDGEVLVPPLNPDLPPPPGPWSLDVPEPARKILLAAQRMEFEEGNPVRASRAWRALGEYAGGLKGPAGRMLQGKALFGEARCEAKAGRTEDAVLLFRSVASRFTGVWGEGSLPLAGAALLETASVASDAGDDREASAAWEDLAVFLGRNEPVLPGEVLAFFRENLAARGGPAPLETYRAFEESREAFRAFLRRFPGARREGARDGRYVLANVPGEAAFHLRVPRGEGEAPGRAFFLVNHARLAAVFRQWARDLKLEKGLRLVLTTAEGEPIGGESGAPPGFREVARTSFPEPLSHWRAALFAEALGGVRSLWVLRWSLTLWVILAAVVMVTGGTIFVVRSVSREIRQAREKADFVSSVTHELKTPLTSIRMFTETLMMGRVDTEEERKECVTIIAEETDRLSRLINRMLDFSKMEKGMRRFHFQQEDPASIAREARKAFHGSEGAGEISLQVLEPLPRLRCDREAVLEVLLNLIGNAVKYSDPGSPVTVRTWASKGRVKFAVMDRGAGIPKGDRKRIFQKFYRVDDTLTKEVDGCGLGLSISAHIARAHGGTIEVESEAGQGSIFTLSLPVPGPKAHG